MECGQEMCTYWAGDGEVCFCVLFDLLPDNRDTEQVCTCGDGYVANHGSHRRSCPRA